MSESLRPAAVITPVRGRFEHLVNQRRFLRAVAPGVPHVVVAVDMPTLREQLAEHGLDGPDLLIVDVADDPRGMPTAHTRNIGASTALEAGAQLLIFLDVDCVPLPGFVAAMCAAHADLAVQGMRAVLNGVVTYLPESARLDGRDPASARELIAPHPVRPAPPAGAVLVDNAHHLLWSLAFAIDAEGWRASGGFDERYVGYGAEDTDFGQRVAAAGLAMAWLGGAQALHQWHPSANPPVHHLADIVRNANLYYERWGQWPMEGWLRAFADEGLVEWTSVSLRMASA